MKHVLHYLIRSAYLYFLSFHDDRSHQGDTASPVVINVHDDAVVANVSPYYLSVALDSGLPALNWEGLNFSSPRLVSLARALSPAVLRLGGSSSDYMVFDDPRTDVNWTLLCSCFSQNESPCGSTRTKVDLNRSDWDDLNEFAMSAGMRLLVDLNLLLRDQNSCALNLTNAKSLLDYSHRKGYHRHLSFEIGNEPNFYMGEFGFYVSPEQDGKDMTSFRFMLNTHPYKEWFQHPFIVGPDVADVNYIRRYVDSSGAYLNGVTWHHYSLHAEVATVEQFLDPEIYDGFVQLARDVRDTVVPRSGLPVILGETNTAWGGGRKGLTDTYINGPMWLDKLGVAALMNTSFVVRQTFYGYNYSLVDHQNQPLPDYWLMLLHKRLVGQRVLSATTNMPKETSPFVRVYAHCTARSNFYRKGSITYFVINLMKTEQEIWLNYTGAEIDAYVMTPGDDDLLSRDVYLNGKILRMKSETEFPSLVPIRLSPLTSSRLPAASYAFYVITNAAAKVCL